jgi:hypothetical protein
VQGSGTAPDLAEHVEALAGIQQSDVLRRGNDHRPGQRNALAHGQLGVAGARRHVDHQDIQVAPINIAQELFQRADDHRAAPDHGRILGHHEADRHDLQAMVFHRQDGRVAGRGTQALKAHQARHRRTIDVGVEQADLEAQPRQGERQVGRRGGLAHAALAGGHGNDVLDVRQHQLAMQFLLAHGAAVLGGSRVALAGLARRGQDRRAAQHPGHLVNRPLGSLAHRLQFGRQLRRHLDGEGDVAFAHHHLVDPARRDDVRTAVGMNDAAQNLDNLFLCHACHS